MLPIKFVNAAGNIVSLSIMQCLQLEEMQFKIYHFENL
jgi:hypothetical protein